jgi:hypothetical protein
MDLQNGDKVIYKVAAEAVAAGKYKLVYEKAGKFYGSLSGIPAETDNCIKAAIEEPALKAATEINIVAEAAVENTIAQAPVEETHIKATQCKRTRKAVAIEAVVEESAITAGVDSVVE